MAKRKTKTMKRWAVRGTMFNDDGDYMLFVGSRPRRIRNKWNWHVAGFVGCLLTSVYERFWPEDCHLEPGGGPIEIKLAKVKQVKR